MKSSYGVILLALIILAGTGWTLWIHDKLVQQSTSGVVPLQQGNSLLSESSVGGNPYPASSAAAVNPASPGKSPMTMQRQYQNYFQIQQKVMVDNSELVAEEKELIAEIDAQRARMNAAMIKADPKTASIVAKLELMHQKAVALASTVRPNHVAPPPLPPEVTR